MVKSVADVLSANIEARLSDAKSRRAWALSHKLAVKSVERIVKKQHSPRIDTLEAYAHALKLAPWQLLHPNPKLAQIPAEIIETAEKIAAIEDPAKQGRVLTICKFFIAHPNATIEDLISAQTTSQPTAEPAQDKQTQHVRSR